MSHYDVLGLNRKARLADIKKAYRHLARKHHPDLNPGDKRAEETFKKINEAYEVLGDPQKRKAYDRELDAGPEVGGFGVPPGYAPGGAGWDAESAFGGPGAAGFSSFINEILRGAAAEPLDQDAPRPGGDVVRTMTIPFADALRGLTTAIEIDAETPCSRCGGSGRIPSAARRPCPACGGAGRINRFPGALNLTSTCPRCQGIGTLGWDGCGTCGGAGIMTRRESIRVHIPAGVDNGSRVRVPGKGRAGRHGAPPGDLYIITQVTPHPFFRRIGDNIHCTVPITVSEAALGTRIDVPTIDGAARVRIPPGTVNGQKLRLRGKGAPSLRGTGRGDHYVEARVVTPQARDEKAKRLLQELGTLETGEELRKGLFG